MLNHPAKLHKVYIKQSLSQTIVLDIEQSRTVDLSLFGSVNSSKVAEEEKNFDKK